MSLGYFVGYNFTKLNPKLLKEKCYQYHNMWTMWFYHDTKNDVFYLSCFDCVYEKIFMQDHFAHFEALEDSCIMIMQFFLLLMILMRTRQNKI